MGTNPLESRLQSGSKSNVRAPTGLTEEQRRQWWIARGNRVLWGEEPCEDGNFLAPRRELEWRHENGSYYLATKGNRPLAGSRA